MAYEILKKMKINDLVLLNFKLVTLKNATNCIILQRQQSPLPLNFFSLLLHL